MQAYNNKKLPTVERLDQYYTYTWKKISICLLSISLSIENKRLVAFVIDGERRYLSLRYRENASYTFIHNKTNLQYIYS